jgi:hypothetical protein
MRLSVQGLPILPHLACLPLCICQYLSRKVHISQPLIAPAGEQIQRHARHPAAAYGMVVSCVWRSESVGHVSLDL